MPAITEPQKLQRHTGNSSNKRSAWSNDGSIPMTPASAQSKAAAARPAVAIKARRRTNPDGKACVPPGNHRATSKTAPSAASHAVSAKLMGRNTVFHSGRERRTMTSDPLYTRIAIAEHANNTAITRSSVARPDHHANEKLNAKTTKSGKRYAPRDIHDHGVKYA